MLCNRERTGHYMHLADYLTIPLFVIHGNHFLVFCVQLVMEVLGSMAIYV